MYQIDLDKLDDSDESLKLIRRKDGQWTFETFLSGKKFNKIKLATRLSTYDELFRLAHVVETLHSRGLYEIHVRVKSLLGMRSDQLDPKGGIQLLPITRFINSLGLSSIKVLEPHSLGTIIALNNSTPYYMPWLTTVIPRDSYDIIVSPDAGAYKTNCKRDGLGDKMHISISKYRGEDGTPYSFLPNIESIEGSRCLIIDDYIDGGRSFATLAKDLVEKGGAAEVMLAACHGLFSYGVDPLLLYITKIWTTDSLSNQNLSATDSVQIIEAP